MCGIAGWIGERVGDDVETAVLTSLRHRGPDGARSMEVGHATLLHTRLAVIDLRETGDQPMLNSAGDVAVVFNGEIYNHRSLRAELEARGHRFRGECDAEVLPYLYEEYGVEFVNKLRGMFAIAVWDQRRHRLLLTRDRFGIKPLFYGLRPGGPAFASEVQALRCIPGVDLTIDAQSVYDFVSLLFIPAPGTIHRGIKAIEPGQTVEIDVSGTTETVRAVRHHEHAIIHDHSLSLTDAAERVGRLLDAAVSSQLESDVPLGALLSGGIDSSLISASAQRSVGGSLRTYNVRFDDPEYDETEAAMLVASHIGSSHSTLDFRTGTGSFDQIAATLRRMGQPYADTSLFAASAVASAMREHVTVALSGDGGDEAFGGYAMYGRLRVLAAALRVPGPLRGSAVRTAALGARAASGVGQLPQNVPGRLLDMADIRGPAEAVEQLIAWIRPRELETLWRGPTVEPSTRHFAKQWTHDLGSSPNAAERLHALATEVDVRLRLANDYLPKVDAASMSVGLEVRVPMLDEDLVAFGLSLPPVLRWSRGRGKRVLREIARDRLPPGIHGLPKHGFGVPVDTWVDDEFRHVCMDLLSGGGGPVADFLEPATYRPVVEAFCGYSDRPPTLTRQGVSQRVFMLLSLHLALT